MTKVQIHFRLQKPLDALLLQRIAETHTLYGIYHVEVSPSLDNVTVEYDATRLRPAEVELALSSAGIPVERV